MISLTCRKPFFYYILILKLCRSVFNEFVDVPLSILRTIVVSWPSLKVSLKTQYEGTFYVEVDYLLLVASGADVWVQGLSKDKSI